MEIEGAGQIGIMDMDMMKISQEAMMQQGLVPMMFLTADKLKKQNIIIDHIPEFKGILFGLGYKPIQA